MARTALVLSLAVALAALADGWLAVRPDRAVVPADVMRAAGARLRAIRQPNDLLVHSPLLTLSELAPLGDLDVRPDRPPAVMQARRRTVALDFAGYPMFGLGSAPDAEETVGAQLVIRTFAPTGRDPGTLWSLNERIGPDTLAIIRSGQRRSCNVARPEGGFRCPGEPEWLYAAERVLKVGGERRACVWAHPTTNGTMVLTVPAQASPTPSRRLALRVGAGLVDEAVRGTPDGAAVITDIVQGDRALGRLTVANRVHWFEQTVFIAPDAPVELRVTTARDGRRHHCIRAAVHEVSR